MRWSPSTVIVDSGPLIAVADRRDRHHDLASGVLRASAGTVTVPDPVITEVDIVLRRWLGPPAARAFLAAMRDGVHRRQRLSESVWRRAIEIDARHADLDLGLVDSAVMAVAERTAEPVFTFDFRAFRAVPGPLDGAWSLVVTERDLA